MTRIHLQGIELRFDERILLRSGHMELEEGRVYPLLGLNGTGKTTFLRMLAGFVRPSAGSFDIHGSVLYQPQKPYLFAMTVLDNAVAGMIKPDKPKALPMLADFGLADFAQAKASTLSGGEQQRLCLCRSLLTGGDILLLDEPFSAIDPASADTLALYLREHCLAKNITLILAVHNAQTARLMAEKCLMIQDGELNLCDM